MKKTDLKNLRNTYEENNNLRVQHLDAQMPSWLIWTGVVIAAIAALTEWTTLIGVLDIANGVLYGIVNTAGYIILYWGLMRGMKKLPHKLTAFWWILIFSFFITALGYLDIPTKPFGMMLQSVGAFMAFCTIIIIGILLIIWYEGRLRTLGILMEFEAVGMMIIPIIFFALLQDNRCYWDNIITTPITLALIWVIGNLLQEQSRK